MRRYRYVAAIFAVLLQMGAGERSFADMSEVSGGLLDLPSGELMDSELAAQRGRQGLSLDYQIAESEQDAQLEDNVLIGGITGGNAISGGAFRSAKGFTSVIQNSGNHVIIQEATLINVYIKQ